MITVIVGLLAIALGIIGVKYSVAAIIAGLTCLIGLVKAMKD